MIPKMAHAHLTEALLDGDSKRARRALFAAMQDGASVAALCDGPIAEALHQVGEKWKHGDEGILIEHRTTIVCIQLLVYLRMQLPLGRGSPVAVGGTPGGDSYQVPSMMGALVFHSEGWGEINLGPDVTTAAYVSSIQMYQPTALWISFSVEEPAHRFVQVWKPLLHEAERSNVIVFVGGRAFPDGAETHSPCLCHLPDMAALAQDIRRRWPQPSGPG